MFEALLINSPMVQVYNRVHIQLYTHDKVGTDKISELDIKMAKFMDRRSGDAVLLDQTPMIASANDALQKLMTLSPTSS